jgi:hypothetical protein
MAVEVGASFILGGVLQIECWPGRQMFREVALESLYDTWRVDSNYVDAAECKKVTLKQELELEVARTNWDVGRSHINIFVPIAMRLDVYSAPNSSN